ncbi:MAG: GNAT family N-acetyltransferase [Anaerolineae bacterium]
MHKINIVEREMTPDEFTRMNAGFDENTLDNGVVIQSSERMGFVALDGGAFAGCVSGLAYKNGDAYNGWFYLTDMFVEKAYRGRGLGAKLLKALEDKVRACGIDKIWTWTAGYEGLGFYKKQGYTVFAELENWYSTGHSRVGMRKRL